MKIRAGFVLSAALVLFFQSVHAADTDVAITCDKKRIELKAGGTAIARSDEKIQSEQWGYAVTVENQTFKPLADLQVKYMIFYKHEQLGVKGPPRKESKSGTYTIPSIDSLGKASFDTASVKLTKAALVGEPGSYTYFTNGAKPMAADSLTGVWVRIYQNGTLFAEYSYPSDVSSTQTWKD